MIEVLLKDSIDRGLNAVTAKLSGFSKTVLAIGGGLTAAGASITAPLLAALPFYADTGKQLDLVAQKTGLTVGLLSQLKFEVTDIGPGLEGLQKGMGKLSQKMAEASQGNKAAIAEFQQLGISSADLLKASPDQRLNMVADALARIPDVGMRSAAALALLGKGGVELLPLLSRGAAGLQALRDKAAALGEGATDASVAKAKAVADAYDDFGRVWKSIPKAAAGAIAEPMTRWMNWMTGAGVAVKTFVKEHQSLIATAFTVGKVFTTVGSVFLAFAAAQKAVAVLQSPLTKMLASAASSGMAFLASPVGLATAALVAGVAAWAMYTESGQAAVAKVREAFGPLAETVTGTVAGVKDALAAGDFTLAAQIAGTGLKLGFLQGMSGLGEMVTQLFGASADGIADLASDAIQGNWSAVIEDMGIMWANYCGGIVSMFSGAIDEVTKLWADMVGDMSKWMLEAAAGDGVMGGVARTMLGIDMRDVNAKDKALTMQTREKDRKLAAATLPKVREELAAAKSAGDADLVAKKEWQVKDLEAKSAGTYSYGGQSAKDAAKQSIDQQVGDWKKSVDEWIRADASQHRARAQQAREEKGTKGFDALTDGLAKQLADLNAKAAEEKAAFEAKMAAGIAGAGAGEGGAATPALKWGSPSGTFSAYSLNQQFGTSGGGTDEKILDATTEQTAFLDQAVTALKEIAALVRSGDGPAWGAMTLTPGG